MLESDKFCFVHVSAQNNWFLGSLRNVLLKPKRLPQNDTIVWNGNYVQSMMWIIILLNASDVQWDLYIVFWFSLYKKRFWGAPGGLSELSFPLLISAQVMISGLWDRAPCQALSWSWSLLKISTPLYLSVSLSLSLSLLSSSTHALSLKKQQQQQQ